MTGSTDVRVARDASRPESSGGVGQPKRRLSRKERVGLVVHRQLDLRLSPLGVWVYRRTKGGIARPWHRDVLLLTTTGRRSGRRRTVVLQFFPDGDAMILLAANDGGRSHPGWFFNLRADPAATVEIDDRRLEVRAEVLPSAEGATWWPRILARDPAYIRYSSATDREIPVVRLTATAPPGQATAP